MKITQKTSMSINNSVEGETIEQKVERILNNGEPIEDSAPIIYQERKEGVAPEYDIRTDRFEIAIDATDKITKSKQAKREQVAKGRENNSNKTESTEATENK